MDLTKVSLFKLYNQNTEVLPDQVDVGGSVSEKNNTDRKSGVTKEAEFGSSPDKIMPDDVTRGSIAVDRLSEWAISKNDRLSTVDGRPSQFRKSTTRNYNFNNDPTGKVNIPGNIRSSITVGDIGGSIAQGDVRGSIVNASGSLRPKTPGNKMVKR